MEIEYKVPQDYSIQLDDKRRLHLLTSVNLGAMGGTVTPILWQYRLLASAGLIELDWKKNHAWYYHVKIKPAGKKWIVENAWRIDKKRAQLYLTKDQLREEAKKAGYAFSEKDGVLWKSKKEVSK